jgi:metal transporter CNNM
MEPTISLKSNHANGSRAVIFHLIIILLALASCLPTCQSQQLISYNPRGGPVIVENDIFLLDSGASYSFILFGFSLTNDTILKWTQSEDACNENEALFGNTELVSVANENGGLIRATYDVSFPLVAARTNLYFCLRNNNDDFAHQSNDTLLKLIVIPTATELLPLPVNIIFILILMCLSGLFSGLNLGLMSLDPTTLKIIMKSGTKQQRRCAKIIQTVRRFGNYLLCTLLLGNVLVNSAFTILLDGVIGNGAYAVVGSTLAIVIFGEIIPQAICSRYGLFIGAYTIPLTYVFMALTFPLSFPISLILTLILGKEIGAVYNRQQLLELLSISRDVNQINDHELDILSGALQFKDKTVAQIMTKFEHVFCVDINSCLDFPTIKEIYDSGFSRIPIYENERDCIVGILHLRDLTFIDPEDYVPVRQVQWFLTFDVFLNLFCS